MSGWLNKKAAMLKTYHRQKRMQKWIAENGPPCEEDEERQQKEWEAKNKITVCPPFGHNSKGD
tara:strand:+ start:101 stop:289 length:189 start_codon:yes stop_codon:yes gene_type:complete